MFIIYFKLLQITDYTLTICFFLVSPINLLSLRNEPLCQNLTCRSTA
jgi:hypothetical protein